MPLTPASVPPSPGVPKRLQANASFLFGTANRNLPPSAVHQLTGISNQSAAAQPLAGASKIAPEKAGSAQDWLWALVYSVAGIVPGGALTPFIEGLTAQFGDSALPPNPLLDGMHFVEPSAAVDQYFRGKQLNAVSLGMMFAGSAGAAAADIFVPPLGGLRHLDATMSTASHYYDLHSLKDQLKPFAASDVRVARVIEWLETACQVKGAKLSIRGGQVLNAVVGSLLPAIFSVPGSLAAESAKVLVAAHHVNACMALSQQLHHDALMEQATAVLRGKVAGGVQVSTDGAEAIAALASRQQALIGKLASSDGFDESPASASASAPGIEAPDASATPDLSVLWELLQHDGSAQALRAAVADGMNPDGPVRQGRAARPATALLKSVMKRNTLFGRLKGQYKVEQMLPDPRFYLVVMHRLLRL